MRRRSTRSRLGAYYADVGIESGVWRRPNIIYIVGTYMKSSFMMHICCIALQYYLLRSN